MEPGCAVATRKELRKIKVETAKTLVYEMMELMS